MNENVMIALLTVVVVVVTLTLSGCGAPIPLGMDELVCGKGKVYKNGACVDRR